MNVTFKLLENNKHNSTITVRNTNTSNEKYITIDVENELSITSDEIYFTSGNTYKLSITIQNDSSDPIVLYSFWKSSVTESRYFVFAGEDKEFPTSETQSIRNEWKTYEELFNTNENEKFMKIRISSNSGIFHIINISIEKVK